MFGKNTPLCTLNIFVTQTFSLRYKGFPFFMKSFFNSAPISDLQPNNLENSYSDIKTIDTLASFFSTPQEAKFFTLAEHTTSSLGAQQVVNSLQHSIPDTKLFYPEPFLASPSYMHSDLSFLHILQYWYWLWFLFIFLICFFFITFLSTIR